MSFIGAEDNAFVTCEDTSRSIRDYSENTQVLLSGKINQEDGNYNNNNSEINIRMVSSVVHLLIEGDYIWIKKDTVSFHLTWLSRWKAYDLMSCMQQYFFTQLSIWSVKMALQWKSFKHYFVLFEHKFYSLLIWRP